MIILTAVFMLSVILWWTTGAGELTGSVQFGGGLTAGGSVNSNRGLGGYADSYTIVSALTGRDRMRLQHAEDAAMHTLQSGATSGLDADRRLAELEQQIADWASILKDARIDLSRQQASFDEEMKLMKLAVESAEVARRKSAVKLLASKSAVGGSNGGKPSLSLSIGRTAVLSAASAAASNYDEFAASTLPPLRIFVYDLPPSFNEDLQRNHPDCRWDSAYTWETKYTLEVYLHEMLLKSPLRTLDPKEADLFYVPVYVGCFLHSHGTNFIKTQEFIKKSQQWLRTHYPFWDRSQGRDHVFTLTHDIGACIAPVQELRHAILITNTGELLNRKEAFSAYTSMYTPGYQNSHDLSLPCFSPWKDIVAPPMINDEFMLGWHNAQKKNKVDANTRNLLATFRGTIIDKPGWSFYSRGIRQKWLDKYAFNENIKITAVHPREGFGSKAANYQATYRKDFTSSKYCLCPPGWATWTPRLFEALLLGCIPAVVADHNLLPFSRRIDYTQFAVHISEDKANDLEKYLPQSKARVQELQLGVSAIWPAFVYNDPPKPGDAFHHLLAELFWKSKGVQRGQRWVGRL